jgi:hypothetical protein
MFEISDGRSGPSISFEIRFLISAYKQRRSLQNKLAPIFFESNSLTSFSLNQCFLDVIFMLFERTTVMKKEIFGVLQVTELLKDFGVHKTTRFLSINVCYGEVLFHPAAAKFVSFVELSFNIRLFQYIQYIQIHTENIFCAAADPTPSKRHKTRL